MNSYDGIDQGRDPAYVQVAVGTRIEQMQRVLILATLRHCGGNKTRAAAMLGISLKTLYNRLNEYRSDARSDSHSAIPAHHDSRPDR